MRKTRLLFYALGVMLALGPASAQEQDTAWQGAAASAMQPGPSFGALMDRLNRLERDLGLVQRALYREGGGEGLPDITAPSPMSSAPSAGAGAGAVVPAESVARLQTRVQSLEALIRNLTGRVEETQHQIRTLSTTVQRMDEENRFRLDAVEKRLGMAALPAGDDPLALAGAAARDAAMQPEAKPAVPEAAPMAARAPKSDAPPAMPLAAAPVPAASAMTLPEDPAAAYRQAFGLLRRADYASAAAAFRAFLAAHPGHDLASNAQYWLAETYYVRGDYAQAATAFGEGLAKYRDGSKGPDSMLKLAFTLGHLNQTEKACALLASLTDEYPDAAEATRRQAARQRETLSCP